MTYGDAEPSRALDVKLDGRAEALIIKVYRCAMAGFSFAETDAWDMGWRTLGENLSPAEAGALFGHFYGFARALICVTTRPLTCRPATCGALCADEALVLRMIGTAQRSDFVGTLAAASLLLAVDELGDALQATQSLGAALTRGGIFLKDSPEHEPCGFDLCPHRRLN